MTNLVMQLKRLSVIFCRNGHLVIIAVFFVLVLCSSVLPRTQFSPANLCGSLLQEELARFHLIIRPRLAAVNPSAMEVKEALEVQFPRSLLRLS